jgi:hypothetical protein
MPRPLPGILQNLIFHYWAHNSPPPPGPFPPSVTLGQKKSTILGNRCWGRICTEFQTLPGSCVPSSCVLFAGTVNMLVTCSHSRDAVKITAGVQLCVYKSTGNVACGCDSLFPFPSLAARQSSPALHTTCLNVSHTCTFLARQTQFSHYGLYATLLIYILRIKTCKKAEGLFQQVQVTNTWGWGGGGLWL